MLTVFIQHNWGIQVSVADNDGRLKEKVGQSHFYPIATTCLVLKNLVQSTSEHQEHLTFP